MFEMVKKMNKNTKIKVMETLSRNLRFGGLAFIVAAALIYTVRPSNIMVLLTPYTGNPVLLSSVLAVLGGLTSMLGHAIKK